MSVGGRTDLTSVQAQAIHDAARLNDPEHDLGSCWCCCWDCEIDYYATVANDAAAGIEVKED